MRGSFGFSAWIENLNGILRARPWLDGRLDGVAWLRTGRSRMRREIGWGAVRLNSPYTVDMRDVAFGDGTTLAGNALSSRRSELRYGRVSRMR